MNLSSLSTRTSLFVFLASTVGLGASACGNDDPDSRYSSGLDDDKTASTLSDDDKRTFCRTLDAHVNVTVSFEEIARLGCLPLGLVAPTREACEQVLNTCMKEAPPPVTVNANVNREQACFDDLDSCEADVGTLEACVNVNVGVVRQLLERITCARLGDNDVDRDIQEITTAKQTAGTCAKASASCGQATQILL